MKRSPFKITKMQGAGNDFLIFNSLSKFASTSFLEAFNEADRSSIVKKLCHRKLSAGADGFIFIDHCSQNKFDFQWDFFNSDGSKAEMCGNAARCVAKYAFKNKIVKKDRLKFQSLAGPIEAYEEEDDLIKIKMPPIDICKLDQSLEIQNNHIEYSYIDSGVPHTVIELEHFKLDDSLKELSRNIQKSDVFGDKSTNVTYISTNSGDSKKEVVIQSASFERGVFDFTLACGTGAVASAYYVFQKLNQKKASFKVQVPGGDLFVEIIGNQPYLIGPAEFIAEIELYI
ncbi:MAG: diaminopimelate epimerase [Bdellovibrionaceae bacterium]|jgi:diaminopimelate epimerase|nr:diaminopimelate epimerase [Pseudobdellovibrionaceae bacterium]